MKKLLLLIALLNLSILGNAQTEKTSSNAPFIEVTGKAEKTIVPDEIYIEIYLVEDKLSVEKQEEVLKETLKSLNIPLENLAVEDANSDFIRIKWNKKEVITKKEYLLKVSSAKEVSDVYTALDELEIDRARISKVSHSDIENIRKQTEIEAIKNAKEKADYLLQAIGQKTGTALIIQEKSPRDYREEIRGNTLYSQAYHLTGMQVSSEISKGKSIATISFQKIKVTSEMYVKFEVQ